MIKQDVTEEQTKVMMQCESLSHGLAGKTLRPALTEPRRTSGNDVIGPPPPSGADPNEVPGNTIIGDSGTKQDHTGSSLTTQVPSPKHSAGLHHQNLSSPKPKKTANSEKGAKRSLSRDLKRVIYEIYKQDGLKGFLKGIDKQMLGSLVSFTVFFYWYQRFKLKFMSGPKDLLGNLKASLIAGVICSVSTNPYWVVFTRYQTQKKKKGEKQKSVFQIIRDILGSNEGFMGFFKGIKPALILVSNPVIQFICYEFFKKKFGASGDNSTLKFFLAGALSKLIATLVTYPILTVKTLLHANKSKMSVTDCIAKIYKKEGVRGYYKGIQAKILQTVTNAAMMLTFYEKIQQFSTYLLRKILAGQQRFKLSSFYK